MTSGELLSLVPLFLATLVPASLFVAAFLVSRQRSRSMSAASFVATAAVAIAYLAVALRPVLSWLGFDARTKVPTSVMNDVVQLDLVSSAMFVLVSTLALVVVRYSRTYLAGQRDLDRFARSLLLTVASVTVLVTSNHLAVLVVAWFATDIGLHSLLTFYRTRRQAIIVAHKKFLLSRLADACFVSSIVIIGGELGSLRIDVVNAIARTSDGLSPTLHVATCLLVFGVLLKSAQIPFHGWMQAVMEAPTPVSALLHAGVVNLGGLVLIRFAPLLAQAPAALVVLAAVATVTVVLATLVTGTRVSIKVALAWSTVAQMGFMLLQVALGLPEMALLHLVAHSLYKARAFLAAGSVVQRAQALRLAPVPRPSVGRWALAALTVPATVVGAGVATGVLATPAAGLAGAVLGFALVPLAAAGRLAAALAVALGWFAGHAVASWLVGPAAFDVSPTLVAATGLALLLLFAIQAAIALSPGCSMVRRLHPIAFGGFYVDERVSRALLALWPVPEVPASVPSLSSAPAGARS